MHPAWAHEEKKETKKRKLGWRSLTCNYVIKGHPCYLLRQRTPYTPAGRGTLTHNSCLMTVVTNESVCAHVSFRRNAAPVRCVLCRRPQELTAACVILAQHSPSVHGYQASQSLRMFHLPLLLPPPKQKLLLLPPTASSAHPQRSWYTVEWPTDTVSQVNSLHTGFFCLYIYIYIYMKRSLAKTDYSIISI